MKELTRLKLQLVWDVLGDEPFNRNECYRRIRQYAKAELDSVGCHAEPSAFNNICYGFDTLYAKKCLIRISPGMYKLDVNFFNKEVFQ